tara:strand:+ start:200 stop:346 length:147 start_codon:yes stop_codon:yes gene_type:complete
MKTIILTDEELELLKEVLEMHTDMGPEGSGWKSDALGDLEENINQQGD